MNCCCSDAECRMYGCKLRRGSMIMQTPQGCICPPTSEQTCQSPTCPRKNPLGYGTAYDTADK